VDEACYSLYVGRRLCAASNGATFYCSYEFGAITLGDGSS
jgi:hypothetical protein